MGEIKPYLKVLGAEYLPPAPVSADFDASNFDCGKLPLNDWIKYRALKAQGRSARCYVVATRRNVVAGYYCISTGGVNREEAPSKIRRNMPDHVPVVIIGRLAVDKNHQGKGIGRGLLKDALSRIVTASDIVGVRAVLVHAIDVDAVPFYANYGFHAFPVGTQTLFLPMEEVIATLMAE